LNRFRNAKVGSSILLAGTSISTHESGKAVQTYCAPSWARIKLRPAVEGGFRPHFKRHTIARRESSESACTSLLMFLWRERRAPTVHADRTGNHDAASHPFFPVVCYVRITIGATLLIVGTVLIAVLVSRTLWICGCTAPKDHRDGGQGGDQDRSRHEPDPTGWCYSVLLQSKSPFIGAHDKRPLAGRESSKLSNASEDCMMERTQTKPHCQHKRIL